MANQKTIFDNLQDENSFQSNSSLTEKQIHLWEELFFF